MVGRRDTLNAKEKLEQRGQGNQRHGIEKAELPRLPGSCKDSVFEQKQLPVSAKESHLPSLPPEAPALSPVSLILPRQKRQQGQEARDSSSQDLDQTPSKRPRTLPPSFIVEREPEEAGSDISNNTLEPWIKIWTETYQWPRTHFEQDSQVRDEFERGKEPEEQMEESPQVVQYVEVNGRKYPRPIKKVPTSRKRKQSDSSLNNSSNQTREGKSGPYRNTRFTTLLAAKGSYMREFDDNDIPKSIQNICQTLLETAQSVPQHSLFRDDLFKRTCREIEDRNEAMVIQDVTRLLVPSAKTLSIYGAKHLDHLMENVNEGWTGSIPVQGPRPQPDYCVGFKRSAFADEQLHRLDPLVGTVYDTSFFVATYRMYFPFLTCEVKCGAGALDIADRQNTHSMTIAVRAVVELYRAVKREREVDREILAFSISHDHSSVRIYGHYAVIHENKTTFYRHPIHKFDFTALDGKDKWTAYKFTKNIYDVWMPAHLKRICSAIDQLPCNINFEVSQGSELNFTDASGLSQDVDCLFSDNVGSASRTSQDESELVPTIS